MLWKKRKQSITINWRSNNPSLTKPSGFRLSLKRLYGVTKNGLLTFTGGFSKYNLKNDDGAKEVKVRLVPFMVGYKQNIQWDILMFDF